jgi:signal peptidase I
MPAAEPIVPCARPVRATGSGAGWRRLARDLLRGGFLVLLAHAFVVQISVVRGHSMEPSLFDGDRLIVDRWTYAMAEAQRFDVVVLRYPRNPGVDFVKRIVGLPGERVRIHDGRVLIDGAELDVRSCPHIADHADMRELAVPDGHYFVLGDNRPISCDSREFGLVPADHLRGKVRARLWPPARMSLF